MIITHAGLVNSEVYQPAMSFSLKKHNNIIDRYISNLLLIRCKYAILKTNEELCTMFANIKTKGNANS